jgi:hypothetical protein
MILTVFTEDVNMTLRKTFLGKNLNFLTGKSINNYGMLKTKTLRRSVGHLSPPEGLCRNVHASKINRGGDINSRRGGSCDLISISTGKYILPSYWGCLPVKLRNDHLVTSLLAEATRSPLKGCLQLESDLFGSCGSIEAVEQTVQKITQSWFSRRQNKLQVQS